MTVTTDQKIKKESATQKLGRYQSPTDSVQPPFCSDEPPQSQSTRPKNWTSDFWMAKYWPMAVVLLLTLLLIWWVWEPVQTLLAMVGDQEAVSAYLQTYGALGPIVLALAQLTQVLVAFIPGHVFVIAAGYVYGFPAGFLLNLASTVGASQLAFALARWAGQPLVSRLVPDHIFKRWYRIGEERGFIFFTISFLFPVFPSDMMNFVAGLTGISGKRFLAANLLGRIPGAFMLTLIGSHGLSLSPWAWGAIAVAIASLYLTGRYVVIKIEQHHGQASSPDSKSSSGEN